MEIVDKILNHSEQIQKFLDNLNCDEDKWFVFREWDLENPTLRNFSSKMSQFLMEKNSEKHRIRFLWLKFSEDMHYAHGKVVTPYHVYSYFRQRGVSHIDAIGELLNNRNIIKMNNLNLNSTTTIKNFKIEYEKYYKINNSFLKKDIFDNEFLLKLFSDKRIYGVHYIEAFNGTPQHRDPWKYGKKYNNIIFYSNVPENITLKINGKKVSVKSPMKTNFGFDKHEYSFKTINSPLKVLHIDYEV